MVVIRLPQKQGRNRATAILIPVLISMYRSICDHHKLGSDRALALLFVLGVCFACNQGGPASPAAGGRNAIMVGYLREYGAPITFGRWVLYAMPYVLVVSLALAAFMYLVFGRRIKVPGLNFAEFLKADRQKLGKLRGKEAVMGGILLTVAVLWVTASRQYGLGGPCMFGVVLMLVFRIIQWSDIQTRVRFDVVGLYAAACAIGVGLRVTGGSLWLANSIIGILPAGMRHGDLLLAAISLFTTGVTNFMSDGATVAAVGPVALSMAQVANVSLWRMGLACAFSSSFANATIVGTPNNAIAYVGAVDPGSGERLVTLRDFLIYGLPVTALACVVLVCCAVFGYWAWMPGGP
jgi:sodium-dependent dicarboxylate transporter 2/3/5